MQARIDIAESKLEPAEQRARKVLHDPEANSATRESLSTSMALYQLGGVQLLRSQRLEAEGTCKRALGLY
jgi:hypothetical protein